MCVCVCSCARACVRLCVRACAHVCVVFVARDQFSICVFFYESENECVNIYIYIYIYICVCVCVCVCVHVCTRAVRDSEDSVRNASTSARENDHRIVQG